MNAGFGRLDLVQEWIRERVVELERNAEQERSRDEDEEIAVLEQRERVEAERVAHAEARAGRFRRRVRQRERVDRHDDRRAGGESHRQHQRVGVKHLPDEMPATIHPIVPSTRMNGKSRPGSRTWWNEIEFVSDSVGM